MLTQLTVLVLETWKFPLIPSMKYDVGTGFDFYFFSSFAIIRNIKMRTALQEVKLTALLFTKTYTFVIS